DNRLQCWGNWQQFYAAGQPADKVRYARGQIAQLSGRSGQGAANSSGGQQAAGAQAFQQGEVTQRAATQPSQLPSSTTRAGTGGGAQNSGVTMIPSVT